MKLTKKLTKKLPAAATKARHLTDKVKEYISDPDYRFRYNVSRGLYRSMPDEEYLKRYFRAKHGYELDLEDPKTFSAKLQWLKLYDRNPMYTRMVDKYRVKNYVKKIIGEQYIIPTLAMWEFVEDVDLAGLPDRFVLKCTHDSHGLVIVKDKSKLDEKAALKLLDKCMHRNYYLKQREWPYLRVRPRIIAEQFIGDPEEGLIDYKVHCFNGEPKVILVCEGRFSEEGITQDFYDTEWNHLDVRRVGKPQAKVPQEKPEALEEMLDLSRKLSKRIPFVRCDFYIVDGKLLFGELTFFPTSGFEKFDPESFDREMGDWLRLPERPSIGAF